MQSINPATGQVLAEYPEHGPEDIQAILAANRLACRCFSNWNFEDRAASLHKVAAILEARRTELARLITLEMGKPLAEARREIGRCVLVCKYYADNTACLLAPERPVPGPRDTQVVFEPLGPVLAIMPWNFPFWQVIRSAAPALMAGNSFLLKHAPTVTGCALMLEEIFASAGLPQDLFRTLVTPEANVAAVIADPRVRAVTLTGSCRAGEAVAAMAGRALKKVVLELGGSDPFIVLGDADLDQAVSTAVAARFYNAGQTCISAKRFLVARSVARTFEEKLARAVAALTVGDPMAADTLIGPMAREDLRLAVEEQVAQAVASGARVLLPGGRLEGPGFFFAPVVLAGVRPGMRVFEEEVFGPVASITTFSEEADALRLANATPYGLGASVWTANLSRGRKLAGLLEAGTVAVNALVKSDPRLPFGGVKRSGFGRELGRYGLLEFVNIKTIHVGP